MASIENLDCPVGWLIDPNKKWAIHFDFKNETKNNINADFTIDMWGIVQNGKPLKFKSRRKATKKDYINIWKQLNESNWVEFDSEKIKTA
tara:strand:- start:173 stop:442 length:270 start_codon:yes stop_codon:yes gene_type:complete